ncbi:hypothetical protein ACU60T_25130 [Klebsiella aerogenes]
MTSCSKNVLSVRFRTVGLQTPCIAVENDAANAIVDSGSTVAADLTAKGDLGAPKQFLIDLSNSPTASNANIVFFGQVEEDASIHLIS